MPSVHFWREKPRGILVKNLVCRTFANIRITYKFVQSGYFTGGIQRGVDTGAIIIGADRKDLFPAKSKKMVDMAIDGLEPDALFALVKKL